MKLIKNLLQRRVPQILGIYLATSWAIIEFLDWLIYLRNMDTNIKNPLRQAQKRVVSSLSALVKTVEDEKQAHLVLAEWLREDRT